MARVPLAWLNLLHERTRLLIALAGVVFAVLLMFMNLGVRGALIETTTTVYGQFNAEIVLMSPQSTAISTTTPFPRERLYQVAGIEGVERVMPLYVSYLLWRNPETRISRAMFIYGINPRDPIFLMPEVRSPEAIKTLERPNTVLIDTLSRPEFGPQTIGLETEAGRRHVEIGGQYSLGGGFAADGALIMSDQNFRRFFSPRTLANIDLGLIKLKSGVKAGQVVQVMRVLLPEDVLVLTKEDAIAHDRAYWLQTTSIGFIFSMGVAVSFVVGAMIVYQILFTDIREHLPEYATLKAMGYRNQYLFRLVLQEAILLASLGYLPGLIVSWGLYQLTITATAGSLPVNMNWERAIFVLILTLTMCVLSGLISVRKAMTADPADIFR